jgi:hypothetical protein
MIDAHVRDQLLTQLDILPVDMQRRVLEFAKSLPRNGPPRLLPGTPGKELLPFAGTISEADAREMMQAIEEGCEQIDPDEW